MFKPLQYGLGIALIIIGIAGLFLPFLQGILLIFLGAAVLKADSLKGLLDKSRDVFRRR